MDGVKAISAGQQFAMILKDNGDLYGTGDNSDGQLGLGDYVNRNTPTFVEANIASIDCGTFYTMAIDTDGDLWATGVTGSSGVLGNESTEKRNTFAKVDIPGDKEVTAVSAGNSHTLFITADGNLYGMGEKNGGKLIHPYSDPGVEGDGTWQMKLPVLLSSTLTNVRSISAGENHSMVVTTDNELYAFGTQNYGALGNGVHDFGVGIFTPFKVTDPLLLISGVDAVQEVIAGSNNTLIRKTDGTLLAVGSDYSHNLGDGDSSTAHHPEIFEIDEEVTTANTNGGNTVYGTEDGKVWGAGFDHGSTLDGSSLGQGASSSVEYYISFVEIPLEEND
jgi:alpha-tubulin suppressor-like RCC1 family protein